MQQRRLASVQALRGFGAVAVCCQHLIHNNPVFPLWMSETATYGALGVTVFFVISGFVLPYSMIRANYGITDFWKFLARRVVRIDPPYLVTIALSIALATLAARTPLYKGPRLHFSAMQLALHLGYLIPFFPDFHWVNGVFWTLATEFQFYVLLALFLPLLIANRIARWSIVLAFSFGPLFPSDKLTLSQSSPTFLIGIAGAMMTLGIIGRLECVATILAATIIPFQAIQGTETVVSIATLILIMTVNTVPNWCLLLGEISYSLYLIHTEVGLRLVNLGARFVPRSAFMGLLLVGLFASFGAAMIMYIVIEKPAKLWASRIKYRKGTDLP